MTLERTMLTLNLSVKIIEEQPINKMLPTG